jgi:hypothetical protein
MIIAEGGYSFKAAKYQNISEFFKWDLLIYWSRIVFSSILSSRLK